MQDRSRPARDGDQRAIGNGFVRLSASCSAGPRRWSGRSYFATARSGAEWIESIATSTRIKATFRRSIQSAPPETGISPSRPTDQRHRHPDGDNCGRSRFVFYRSYWTGGPWRRRVATNSRPAFRSAPAGGATRHHRPLNTNFGPVAYSATITGILQPRSGPTGSSRPTLATTNLARRHRPQRNVGSLRISASLVLSSGAGSQARDQHRRQATTAQPAGRLPSPEPLQHLHQLDITRVHSSVRISSRRLGHVQAQASPAWRPRRRRLRHNIGAHRQVDIRGRISVDQDDPDRSPQRRTRASASSRHPRRDRHRLVPRRLARPRRHLRSASPARPSAGSPSAGYRL